MIKRIIIISLISGLAVLGVILLLVALNPSAPAPIENQVANTAPPVFSQLPTAGPASAQFGNQNLTPYQPDDTPYPLPQLIYDQPIIDASLNANGQQVFLVTREERQLIAYNLADQQSTTLSTLGKGCAILSWSPDGKRLAMLNQGAPQIINLETGLTATLDSNIKNLIFSPAGDKIAYQYYSPETEDSVLTTADIDGKNFQRITHLNDLTAPWSNTVIFQAWSPDNYIYVSPESSDLSATPLQRVQLSDHNRQTLTNWTDVRALLFSPAGKYLAAEIYNTKTDPQPHPRLATIDSQTGQQTDLKIDSFLNNCAWSPDEAYLFCPLAADIFSLESQNIITRVNLSTKEQTQITGLVAGQNFNIRRLLASPDDQKLYFINSLDNKLYSVDLGSQHN